MTAEDSNDKNTKYGHISVGIEVYGQLTYLKKEKKVRSFNALIKNLLEKEKMLINTEKEKDTLSLIVDVLIRREGWILEDEWAVFADSSWHKSGFFLLFADSRDDLLYWQINERVYKYKNIRNAKDWFNNVMKFRAIPDADLLDINAYLDTA